MTDNCDYIEIAIYKTKNNDIINKLILKQIQYNNQLIKQNYQLNVDYKDIKSDIDILLDKYMNLFYEIRYFSINTSYLYKIYSNLINCNNGCIYTKSNIYYQNIINSDIDLCLCMLLTSNTYLWLNKKLNKIDQLKFMQIIAIIDPNIYSYLPMFYYKYTIYNKISDNIDIERWIYNLEVNQRKIIINELSEIGLEF